MQCGGIIKIIRSMFQLTDSPIIGQMLKIDLVPTSCSSAQTQGLCFPRPIVGCAHVLAAIALLFAALSSCRQLFPLYHLPILDCFALSCCAWKKISDKARVKRAQAVSLPLEENRVVPSSVHTAQFPMLVSKSFWSHPTLYNPPSPYHTKVFVVWHTHKHLESNNRGEIDRVPRAHRLSALTEVLDSHCCVAEQITGSCVPSVLLCQLPASVPSSVCFTSLHICIPFPHPNNLTWHFQVSREKPPTLYKSWIVRSHCDVMPTPSYSWHWYWKKSQDLKHEENEISK